MTLRRDLCNFDIRLGQIGIRTGHGRHRGARHRSGRRGLSRSDGHCP